MSLSIMGGVNKKINDSNFMQVGCFAASSSANSENVYKSAADAAASSMAFGAAASCVQAAIVTGGITPASWVAWGLAVGFAL